LTFVKKVNNMSGTALQVYLKDVDQRASMSLDDIQPASAYAESDKFIHSSLGLTFSTDLNNQIPDSSLAASAPKPLGVLCGCCFPWIRSKQYTPSEPTSLSREDKMAKMSDGVESNVNKEDRRKTKQKGMGKSAEETGTVDIRATRLIVDPKTPAKARELFFAIEGMVNVSTLPNVKLCESK
jgi:hypothetical protein